jgi:choice-of-anchor B domain-containing protein
MKNIYIIFVLFLFSTAMYAQQSSNVTLLSNLNEYSGIGYSDCWGYTDSLGREYALLCTNTGLSIIEITIPEQPVERAFIPGPPSNWRDVKTHSTYAYVVTEGIEPDPGLQIIDLSPLPDSAVLVNTIDTWFNHAHNLFIDSGYAYVVGTDGGGGMHVIDLSDPVNPARNSYYTGSGYVHDVYVWNDTAYASAATTYDLVDLTDKSNPLLVSKSPEVPEIYAHSGWLTEDKRYFIACEEANVRDMMVWDLQDRLVWDLVVPSFQSPGNTPVHNVFVKGDYAHVSYYTDGYVVFDISDPLNPFIAGNYDTSPGIGFGGVWGVYPYYSSGVTIGSDMTNGLYVFKFIPDTTTSVDGSSNDIPSEYTLKQNYPNPFNPVTVISYSLPQQSSVLITLYDPLGREVRELVNEDKPAGSYTITFNAGDIPSGIYFYRITAGDFTETKKMVLMR